MSAHAVEFVTRNARAADSAENDVGDNEASMMDISLRNARSASPWDQVTTGRFEPEPFHRADPFGNHIAQQHFPQYVAEEHRYYDGSQAPWNYLNASALDAVRLNGTLYSSSDRTTPPGEERAASRHSSLADPGIALLNNACALAESQQPSEYQTDFPTVNDDGRDQPPASDAVPADGREHDQAGVSNTHCLTTLADAGKDEQDPYEYVNDDDDEDAVDDEATLAEDESVNGVGDDGELDELRELGEISIEELRKRFGYEVAGVPQSRTEEEEEEDGTDGRPRRRRRRQRIPVLLPQETNSAVADEAANNSFNQTTNELGQLDEIPFELHDRTVLTKYTASDGIVTEITDSTSVDTATELKADDDDDEDDDDDDADAGFSTEDDVGDDDDADADDDDYIPPQKPSEIRCGVAYQAVVPDDVVDVDIDAHYAALAETTYDFVQWKPETTDDELIVAYQMAAMKQFALFSERGTCVMNKAISDLSPFIHHVHQNPPNHFEPFPDHEDLLHQLVKSAHDLRVGLQRCYIERLPRQSSSLGWLDEESQRFEEALLRFDKNFRAISLHVKTRSVRECVFFYYERKRSARYERHSSMRPSAFSSLYMTSSPTPPLGGSSAGWTSGGGATGSSSSNIYSQRLRNANINVPFYRQQQQQGLLFGVNISYPSPSQQQQQRNDDTNLGSWSLPNSTRYSGSVTSRYNPYPPVPHRRSATAAAPLDNPAQRSGQQQSYANHSQSHQPVSSSSRRNLDNNNNFHHHRHYSQPGLNPVRHSHPGPSSAVDVPNNNNSNYSAEQFRSQQQQMRTTTSEALGIDRLPTPSATIRNNDAAVVVDAGRPATGRFFAPSVPSTTELPSTSFVTQRQHTRLRSADDSVSALCLPHNVSENARNILAAAFGVGSSSAGAAGGRSQHNNSNLSSAFSTTSSNGSSGLVVGAVFLSAAAGQQQLPLPAAVKTSQAVTPSKFFGATLPQNNSDIVTVSSIHSALSSSGDSSSYDSGARSRGTRSTKSLPGSTTNAAAAEQISDGQHKP